MKQKQQQSSAFRNNLRVELARARLTQQQLAERLKVPPTTLSDWLRGAHPRPQDLQTRIECALALKPGALSRAEGGAE